MERPLEIVLADDEPIVRRRLKLALEKDGYRVEVYEDGADVLRRMREKTFDIVITDIRMEEVDGISVLQEAIAQSSRTKVIIITGFATVELAREALAEGAFDLIAKPFKPDDLREIIERAASELRKQKVVE